MDKSHAYHSNPRILILDSQLAREIYAIERYTYTQGIYHSEYARNIFVHIVINTLLNCIILPDKWVIELNGLDWKLNRISDGKIYNRM